MKGWTCVRVFIVAASLLLVEMLWDGIQIFFLSVVVNLILKNILSRTSSKFMNPS